MAMLDGQFGDSLYMKCRKQILVQRLVAQVLVILNKIVFLRCCIILNIAGEIKRNVVFVPQECARLQLGIVQRRVPIVLVYLLKVHRSTTLQKVNEI